MRETVGCETPNIRAICAAVFRPDITASAISRRLASSNFLRRPPMRPSALAAARPADVRSRIMTRSNSAVCGAPHTAQFERSLTQERVNAGLAAARRRGRRGGRPVVIDAEKLAAVIAALNSGATKAAVCRTFGVKRSTLIDSLDRVGWSAGIEVQGGMSDATPAVDRSPDRSAVRSAHRAT